MIMKITIVLVLGLLGVSYQVNQKTKQDFDLFKGKAIQREQELSKENLYLKEKNKEIESYLKVQSDLLDEKQNEINGLLLDYEAEKAKYKIVKQEVVKTVEKIVERPVYQNDCFDQDGVDALNKLIGAKS